MTSKPKLNQPDVEITTTFNGMDIPESLNVNITIPSNMLKDFINQQSDPTLSECIKEWVERNWEVRKTAVGFKFCKNSNSINFYVKEYNEVPTYRTSLFYINYELSILISKTLKALENYNEQGISN